MTEAPKKNQLKHVVGQLGPELLAAAKKELDYLLDQISILMDDHTDAIKALRPSDQQSTESLNRMTIKRVGSNGRWYLYWGVFNGWRNSLGGKRRNSAHLSPDEGLHYSEKKLTSKAIAWELPAVLATEIRARAIREQLKPLFTIIREAEALAKAQAKPKAHEAD